MYRSLALGDHVARSCCVGMTAADRLAWSSVSEVAGQPGLHVADLGDRSSFGHVSSIGLVMRTSWLVLPFASVSVIAPCLVSATAL